MIPGLIGARPRSSTSVGRHRRGHCQSSVVAGIMLKRPRRRRPHQCGRVPGTAGLSPTTAAGEGDCQAEKSRTGDDDPVQLATGSGEPCAGASPRTIPERSASEAAGPRPVRASRQGHAQYQCERGSRRDILSEQPGSRMRDDAVGASCCARLRWAWRSGAPRSRGFGAMSGPFGTLEVPGGSCQERALEVGVPALARGPIACWPVQGRPVNNKEGGPCVKQVARAR